MKFIRNPAPQAKVRQQQPKPQALPIRPRQSQAAQMKKAATTPHTGTPAAPPVYRPQAAPKILQMKTKQQQASSKSGLNTRRPTPPRLSAPVYAQGFAVEENWRGVGSQWERDKPPAAGRASGLSSPVHAQVPATESGSERASGRFPG